MRFSAVRFIVASNSALWGQMRGIGLLLTALFAALFIHWDACAADDAPEADGTKEVKKNAHMLVARIEIPLPIQGLVDTQIQQKIEHFLNSGEERNRPILVLQFSHNSGTADESSQFERALSLARFLSSEKLSQVRTIAYLPGSVTGHAVLPVLACEQIIMAPDAELGNAGVAETTIDASVRQAYVEIADRRRVVPAAVAIGMLDRGATVSRVQTAEGSRFVLTDELAVLEKEGQVVSVETVVRAGDLGLFSGRELRVKYGIVSHLASNLQELADSLDLPRNILTDSAFLADVWRPIEVEISGPIHPRLVTMIMRGVNDALANDTANLLVIRLQSAGGNLSQSLRLAKFLTFDLDREKMRSVVFVEREARGDAALVALAADDLIVDPQAILGGPGNVSFSDSETQAAVEDLKMIASKRDKEWSLFAAMLNPTREVSRWTHETHHETRFMSDEEQSDLADASLWIRGERLATIAGVKAVELNGTHWLEGIVSDRSQLAAHYGWKEEPRAIKDNWALGFIEFLANPRLAFMLLFVAWGMLWAEMSSPGIGVPGFVSALCFMLFFWAQFLHGNADVLEILLFGFGIFCVALEIFVIPGMGIFGIGGGLAIVLSIVLASQTFIFPTNTYQLRQLPYSLGTILVGLVAAITALWVVRRFLPHTPFFNRLLLVPPAGEELLDIQKREAFGSWEVYQGKRGEAVTPLVPAGKIRIGEEIVDVLSEGELIARGEQVEVTEVQGTRVIVRKLN